MDFSRCFRFQDVDFMLILFQESLNSHQLRSGPCSLFDWSYVIFYHWGGILFVILFSGFMASSIGARTSWWMNKKLIPNDGIMMLVHDTMIRYEGDPKITCNNPHGLLQYHFHWSQKQAVFGGDIDSQTDETYWNANILRDHLAYVSHTSIKRLVSANSYARWLACWWLREFIRFIGIPGFPIKNVIILVVTGILVGGHTQ